MKHSCTRILVNTTAFLLIFFTVAFYVPSAAAALPGFIPPEEVQQWRQTRKTFFLIDVRPTVAFKNKQIEGAINIPAFIIHKKGLPLNEIIVLYDGGIGSREAKEAAQKLMDAGYSAVYLLQGGLAGWEKKGFSTAAPVGVVKTLLVESLTSSELTEALKEGLDMLLIDLRRAESFKENTIPGAVNVAPQDLMSVAGAWAKDALIVLFDSGDGEAARQAEQLRRADFKITRFLFGGYPEWRKQNTP